MAQPGYVGPPMGQPGYIGPTMLVVGEYPVQCTCPQCRNQVVTRTEKKTGLLTWLVCAGLFVIGCWPCYFIPFCVDACKVSSISI
jgi:lipopolysaccharide-induced tumor necrosis factor-alpha factor